MREIWRKKKMLIVMAALAVGIFGTAATAAIVTAAAGTVTNTFDAGEVKTKITEEFEGVVEKNSTIKKNPSILNEGKSNVFIRARITISPEDADAELLCGTWNGSSDFVKTGFAADKTPVNGLYDPDKNGIGWYAAEDGWYYYSAPVAANDASETLFDAVKIGDTEKNFDITVYQEAVYSKNYEVNKTVALELITACFDEVDKK